jgi:hypothetical protein
MKRVRFEWILYLLLPLLLAGCASKIRANDKVIAEEFNKHYKEPVTTVAPPAIELPPLEPSHEFKKRRFKWDKKTEKYKEIK